MGSRGPLGGGGGRGGGGPLSGGGKLQGRQDCGRSGQYDCLGDASAGGMCSLWGFGQTKQEARGEARASRPWWLDPEERGAESGCLSFI